MVGQPRFLVSPDWRWGDPDTRTQARWRLLSGNNRQLGRSAGVFEDVTTARDAVIELQQNLADCEPIVVRLGGPGRWVWSMMHGGLLVAVSGRSYEMERTVVHALDMFLASAASAPVPPETPFPRPRQAFSASPVAEGTVA